MRFILTILFIFISITGLSQPDSIASKYIVYKIVFTDSTSQFLNLETHIHEGFTKPDLGYIIKSNQPNIFLLPKDSLKDSTSYLIDFYGYTETDSTFIRAISAPGYRLIKGDTVIIAYPFPASAPGGITDPKGGYYTNFPDLMGTSNYKIFRRKESIPIDGQD